ncbi:hypothetical protein BDP27DRAFT_490228 [Rhodocollybia butyracea]|uniref:Uncharacterized protein n=1 Tax=Rhodocollybia butyracea TaxID=206335 RepID=A0A9P5Q9H0_9AGAR|nr:hypothetical protein BDP27DRAFT_490228 [Rhodocollybia butyracea]
MLPLIQSVNPDYIDRLEKDSLEAMLIWLKKIHPVPGGLIQVWEDFKYMTFIERTFNGILNGSPIIKMSSLFARHLLSQSPEALHFLRLLVLPSSGTSSISVIRLLLGVSWSDLRSTISYLRSIIGEDEELFTDLCNYTRELSFTGESFPWPSLSRDLARQSIHIGKDIHAGKLKDVISWHEIRFSCNWAIHVRLSPSCNELLHDIWSLHPSQLPECNAEEIYYVLKWLESFPDPPSEVITRWTQYLADIQVTDWRERDFDADKTEKTWKSHLSYLYSYSQVT